MKKELAIIIGIFLLLAILMHHEEWMSHPIEHIQALPSAGAYGLGVLHPLIFTIAGYIFFVLLRSVFKIIKKVVKR
jgi:hypothetical protein